MFSLLFSHVNGKEQEHSIGKHILYLGMKGYKYFDTFSGLKHEKKQDSL